VTFPLYLVESVVPQRPPMILIDEIVAREAESIVVVVAIRTTDLFFQPDRGVPSHVALEWMAQACAAFAGCEALDAGRAVRIGFLLGTRDFQAARAWFAEGERLYVRALLEYRDNELANFACEVADSADGPSLARASLNVYQPDDASALVGSHAASPS
jgi:predicted hotdog family 3-hydroxylacyl-ACP dehydratase